jgi:hypothetical protein
VSTWPSKVQVDGFARHANYAPASAIDSHHCSEGDAHSHLANAAEVIDGAVPGSTGLKAVASVSGTFTYTPQAASSAISEPVISVTVPVGGRDGVEHR